MKYPTTRRGTLAWLRRHGGCHEYCGWFCASQSVTLADAWDKCQRSDWMHWLLAQVQYSGNDKALRLYAVWCARQVEYLMTDERSKRALDVAERFANGEATQDELDAAYAAAYAAYAARAAYAAQANRLREMLGNPFAEPIASTKKEINNG